MEALAETRSGTVKGRNDDGILSFRGIPFAVAPVGDMRWQPPARETPFDTTFDADSFGPIGIQGHMALEAMMGGTPPNKSEDCLTLNVWTSDTEGSRPVLVWIHGGGFMFGSGSTPWYDGSRFVASGDVVVVTINYRLGPFGFLYLGELFDGMEHSGNLGILDQVAALQWVRDSIAGFGGDPDNITIFGESAGAGSIATLLGTPSARGLFHKAILQSGAASWGLDRSEATNNARKVLAQLGIEPGDKAALLSTSSDAVLTASEILGGEVSGGKLPFAPVHDGVVLPEPPLVAIANGSSANVHVICGTNTDEMTLFSLMDPTLATLDDHGMSKRVTTFDSNIDGDELVRTYRDSRGGASAADVWIAMSTDAVFRIPAIRLVEAHLKHGPAWMYLFTWASPAFGGALKSTHALEIPFVFDNLDQPGVAVFTGDGPERQGIADGMHAAWLAFANNHDPAHAGIPEWPTYDLDRRQTMKIDANWELLHDPMGDERKFWEHETAL